MPWLRRGAFVLLAPLLLSCGGDNAPQGNADLVLHGGRIYTMDSAAPWAEALAVRDGRIVAIGTDAEVEALTGPQTQVVGLEGAFAMPGINDGHSHPAWGGVIALYYCHFSAAAPPDEVIRTIEQCVAEADDDTQWIQGGLWTPTFFERFGIQSPREWLDRISGDKAIALKDDSGHNYWVNSRGLELLGIDERTEPPPGAVYERVPGGEALNGVLNEAFDTVNRALPEWTVEHYMAGARYAQEAANRFGITGFKDASASATEVQAYHTIDTTEGLTVHVAACLFDQPLGAAVDVAALGDLRDRYASANLHTNFVKLFLDGVPTTARTAAMLAPYKPRFEGEDPVYGPLHLEPGNLKDSMVALDAAGFTVKIHTAGDRSVHEGLNAVEMARKTNGDSGLRHELAHAGFVEPADIPRFAELGVVADLSPYLWFPSPIIDDVLKALGDRGALYWPNRSLLDSGAPLLAGSDWPSVAEDMNPWVAIETLVTRRHPEALHAGVSWPEEALTVAEALRIFTVDGAAALKLEEETGTLSVGRRADLIVLDRNPLEVPAEQLSEVQVQLTLFGGTVVHERQDGTEDG